MNATSATDGLTWISRVAYGTGFIEKLTIMGDLTWPSQPTVRDLVFLQSPGAPFVIRNVTLQYAADIALQVPPLRSQPTGQEGLPVACIPE